MTLDHKATLDREARRLADVLRHENGLLATGDTAGAVQLVPEKQAALAAFQTALPDGGIAPDLAADLRGLAMRNRTLLGQAVEVQGRILAMVARAARDASPGAIRYGAHGARQMEGRALALGLRA